MNIEKAKKILKDKDVLWNNPEKNVLEAIEKVVNRLQEFEKQMDLDYVDNNYIPKSKMRKKIEELEDIKLCGGNINKAIIEDKIHLLQDLLKENK